MTFFLNISAQRRLTDRQHHRQQQRKAWHAEWGCCNRSCLNTVSIQARRVGLGVLNGMALHFPWTTVENLYLWWECVSTRLCQGRRETVIFFFLRKISLLMCSEILCCVIWAIVNKIDQTCQKMFLSAKFIARSLSVHCVCFFDFPPVRLPCLTGLTHNSGRSCWVNFLFSSFLSP